VVGRGGGCALHFGAGLAGRWGCAERAWIERAEALVRRPRALPMPAGFRQDVEAQRERLREIVRQEGSQPTPERGSCTSP